jgi:hypothetical protein
MRLFDIVNEQPVATLPGTDWKTTLTNYGCIVTDPEGENQFVITYSFGQDGRVKWAVVHTSVDYGLDIEHGDCVTGNQGQALAAEIDAALHRLTHTWRGAYSTS